MPAKTPPGGITIAVRVQPKSRHPGLLGIVAGVDGRERLRIAVAEPPTEGRATEAVRRVLAQFLDVPTMNVKLVAGGASRDKLFVVAGDTADLISRLARVQLRAAAIGKT